MKKLNELFVPNDFETAAMLYWEELDLDLPLSDLLQNTFIAGAYWASSRNGAVASFPQTLEPKKPKQE